MNPYLIAIVHSPVGADGDGQELSRKLQNGLVFKDDGPPVDASTLHPQPVLAGNVVARRHLQQDGPGLFGVHVDMVAIDFDPVPGQGGSDPHGLGLLQQVDHHLIDGGGPDDLAGNDEVGGGAAIDLFLSHVLVVDLRDFLLPDVTKDAFLALRHQGQDGQQGQEQQGLHLALQQHKSLFFFSFPTFSSTSSTPLPWDPPCFQVEKRCCLNSGLKRAPPL